MELRPLDPTSEFELEATLELFKTAYKREISREFYTWRFLANPFGPPMVSLLWDDRILVGHYAASPAQSLVGDEVVPSAQSMTTMTHPEYRNQGVFVKLAEHLYARMEDLGRRMVWGFPNTQSHYGFVQRLGWQDVALIVTLTRSTEPVPADAPTLTRVNAVDQRITELLEPSSDGGIYPSYRSAEYVNWRYIGHPSASYALLCLGDPARALAVVKSYEVSPGRLALEVVDVWYGRDPAAVGPLFSGLLAHASASHHALVRTWFGLADPAFPSLERLSFAPKEPIAYFGARAFGNFLPGRKDRPDSRWVISMGNSDNY